MMNREYDRRQMLHNESALTNTTNNCKMLTGIGGIFMKELFEELKNTDSVAKVLLEHKKESIQLAAIAVVLLMAVLLYLHQGSAELEISDSAAEGTAAAQEEAGAAGTADGSKGNAGDGSESAGDAAGGSREGRDSEAGLAYDTDGIVYVDIGGAVKNPMLAELPSGSRVEDAIKAAGGLTKKADMTGVNRAQILTDGEKIYIPEEGEDVGAASGGSSGSASSSSAGSGAGGSTELAGISGGRININTADVTLLQQLTGVGPVTAQKIVDYREQNGKFTSVDDLKNVSGIGEKTFEKMKDDVTI